MKYLVVYERAEDGGWGAYLPDLPGVGIVAPTQDEARESIRIAVEMHVEGMRELKLPLPEPSSAVDLIDVA